MEPSQERKAEFANLLRAENGRLYGYIHALLRDLNDADDVFQQVALVLWQKFDEYDRGRPFFPWACRVAWLEAANFFRSRSRHRLYLTDEVSLMLIDTHADMGHDELEDRREALARCLENLRGQDRELVRTCYGEAGGVRRAAEEQGRAPQSIYNSLRRIRRALFECIRGALKERREGLS